MLECQTCGIQVDLTITIVKFIVMTFYPVLYLLHFIYFLRLKYIVILVYVFMY